MGYLQGGDPLAGGGGVAPQQPLRIQEATLASLHGRLEQTIIQHVSQRLGQTAQDLLLSNPHRGVWIKPQTCLLRDRDRKGERKRERTKKKERRE